MKKQQWLTGLDVAPGTARLAFSKLKQILNAAVRDGIRLRVLDVNFLKRTVRVVQQLQRRKGEGMAACPPKTRSSVRTLPTVVANALSEHLRKDPAGPDDYVFRMESGGPVSPTWFTGRVLPAGVGLHDLRHASVCMLVEGGESVKAVSERLGHTNVAMTLNVYSHSFPDSAEHTRRAVDDAFAAALPSSALDVPLDLSGRQ